MIRNLNLRILRARLFCALLGLSLCGTSASRVEATQVWLSATATIGGVVNATWGEWETLDPTTGTWTAPDDIVLHTANGAVLGTITDLAVFADDDPVASVTFGVLGGAVATNFTISSTLVSFAPLVNPIGTAAASVTVTDQNGSGSASVNGQYPGPFSFQAQYNGGAGVFASLVAPVSVATAHGSNTQSGSVPSTVIPATLTDIQAVFSFTLSKGDLASGTGRFSVVPEPGTIGMLAIGSIGLLACCRRRTGGPR
jgi:hypothetical protein